jgi:FkbM family methyltransferase
MEATFPRSVMSVISLLYPPSLFISRIQAIQREKKYLQMTKGMPSDVILLDERLQIRIIPEARYSYLHFCWMEQRMIIEMRNFLHLTADRKCLYDIGALHGAFSIAFCSATGGRSMAFEPSLLASEVLNKMRALNPQCNVTHFPFAIGGRPGEIMMRLDWQHLIAVPEEKAAGESLHRVKVESLDHFAQSNPLPDCVKIDVEGFEHEVLIGAKEVLAQSRPLLFLEIHPVQLAENGTSVRAVLDLLRGLNYEVLGVDLKPFRELRHLVKGKDVFNLICRHLDDSTGR